MAPDAALQALQDYLEDQYLSIGVSAAIDQDGAAWPLRVTMFRNARDRRDDHASLATARRYSA